MKILLDTTYLPRFVNNPGNANAASYMADGLLHGLRSFFGSSVVDRTKQWQCYKTASPEHLKQLHGRGFTMWGHLNDIEIDRDDIPAKIAKQYYDFILVVTHPTGGTHESYYMPIVYEYLQHYPSNRVAFIDDWDDSGIYFSHVHSECTYFKRERTAAHKQCLPIGYGIPKEKVLDEPLPFGQRGQVWARSKPHSRPKERYLFDDERFYYHDYKWSLFAETCKKGGWDALRHYEIMACGCLPVFTDIEKCPPETMIDMPKDLFQRTGALSERVDGNLCSTHFRQEHTYLAAHALDYVRNYLTTKNQALRVIDYLRSQV